MRTRSALPALAVAFALVLASCGGSSSDGAGSDGGDRATTTASSTDATEPAAEPVATDEVAISGFAFDPPVITVKAGTAVTWTNDDTTIHTVTGDDNDLNAGTLGPSQSGEFTFEEPGTYAYHCDIHTSMTGTVIVTE